MKKITILISFIVFLNANSFGQTTNTVDTICAHPELEARMPGGDAAWRQFLKKNLNAAIASNNGAPQGTYTVIVKGIISKDGKISNVTAETNFGYGMEEEAIRVMKLSFWMAALNNNERVKTVHRMPITFVVE
ncbi:MAG: energy transducer TonB [Ferruginibacter sp.]